MQISRKATNKLVSYVDRYFTWDKRTMKREGTDKIFDFWGVRYTDGNNPRVTVAIDKNSLFLYVSICINGKCIYDERIKKHKQVKAFKQMVRCLG
jgi:hypothetical protein